VTAWDTELEFAYDHGHLYLFDAARRWTDDADGRVDLLMPRDENFFVPLRVEGWANRPPPDFGAWDHVAEFSLPVPSGSFALASGGWGDLKVEIAPGAYRARWSGRNLGAASTWEHNGDEAARAPDAYRLQIWPGPAGAPRSELKRWSGPPRGDLGDLPALLDDHDLDATATITSTEVTGDALLIGVRIAGAEATWERTLRAGGAVRWVTTSEPFHRARLHREHPGLLPFADQHGGLSFRGRPGDPERLADALRAEHALVSGRHVSFEAVVNAAWDGALGELLDVGYGRLASGPVTLLRRYADVAATHGVATHLTVTGPGRAGLCLIELGDSYVVAERFSAY
jgi:hypothetical protein